MTLADAEAPRQPCGKRQALRDGSRPRPALWHYRSDAGYREQPPTAIVRRRDRLGAGRVRPAMQAGLVDTLWSMEDDDSAAREILASGTTRPSAT